MNNIAISPHIFMYALQNQNVERKIAKQIDIKKLNQLSKTNTETSLETNLDSTSLETNLETSFKIIEKNFDTTSLDNTKLDTTEIQNID